MAAFDTAPAHHRPQFGFAGFYSAFLNWQEKRAARAALHAMPDNLLDDLGISRLEIDDVVEGHSRR
ncbi:MAG: DUF1127 domain-containing protein [Pseudomonadota bacterium]